MVKKHLEAFWGSKWVQSAVGDLVITGVLLAASLALAAYGAPPGTAVPRAAEVSAPGAWAARIDLGKDGVTSVPGHLGVTEVEVRGGKVGVRSSPCPRGSCRRSGWLGPGAGGVIVCVPNGVAVRVAPAAGVIDALSR